MNHALPLALNHQVIASLKSKVPFIKNGNLPTLHDEITTQLRGILHPEYTPEQATALLTDFLMDTESLPKKMSGYKREKRIYNGITGQESGGIGAEYFFIDYLKRHSHKSNYYTFSHRKGPHILDHVVKTDFLTNVTFRDETHEESHIFGTQVQYKKMETCYPGMSKATLRKEKHVLHGIQNEQYVINALPKYLRPEIPCLVRLNSKHFMPKIPELDQKITFMHAMEGRQDNGFHGGGPTEHLPNAYREQLVQMSYFYQKSCKSFLRFLFHVYNEGNTHLPFTSHTEHESAYRVNTYDPERKRATYEFYHKTGYQRLFLTIVFRLTDLFHQKFEEIVTVKK